MCLIIPTQRPQIYFSLQIVEREFGTIDAWLRINAMIGQIGAWQTCSISQPFSRLGKEHTDARQEDRVNTRDPTKLAKRTQEWLGGKEAQKVTSKKKAQK